jgi:hypothetical protein
LQKLLTKQAILGDAWIMATLRFRYILLRPSLQGTHENNPNALPFFRIQS